MLDYRDVVRALQVRLIQTALSAAETVTLTADPAAAAAALNAKNYDQAPVLDHGRVIGFARGDALAAGATVRQAVRELGDGLLISADTSLADLPILLAAEPFLFVVDGGRVSGFVTPWDLNKQPSRAHVYFLLADLEMSLALLVRRRFRRDQIALFALLKPDRAKRIRGRYRRARRENREADVASLLDFQDLLDAAGADEYLRRRLGYLSQEEWATAVSKLGDTREGVMHLTGELVGGLLRLEELIDVEHRLRALTVSVGRVKQIAAFKLKLEGALVSQRVTAADISAGRIRFPHQTKSLFPPRLGKVSISLRGQSLTARYDPRMGPDRERSAVLLIGRRVLEDAVTPNDRLHLSMRRAVVHLD